ncbi:MAG: Hsp20/alpha crystallin family protein [Chloroflexi bacterium]|nr:Hsp20/alpha crystallin family protein [Chloroflexota bacterium]
MTLMHYDPFSEMDRMLERMRSLMPVNPTARTYPLALDVASDEDSITVRTALPGFKEDEIDVDVQGRTLTIRAESQSEREDSQQNWYLREMRYGRFSRSVTLPDEVDIDSAEAHLEDGILTIRLPTDQPGPIRKIAVQARKLLNGKK